jgi:hypothetical protein
MTRKAQRLRARLSMAMAVTLAGLLGGAACSKKSPGNAGTGGQSGKGGGGGLMIGGGGGTGGKDLGITFDEGEGSLPDMQGGSVDTATTAPMTCAAIRNCVTACKGDSACKQRCPTMAPTAARNAFTAIEMCSLAKCPDGDEPCRCEVECIAGGECTDMVDVCRDFEDDVFCDVNCH